MGRERRGLELRGEAEEEVVEDVEVDVRGRNMGRSDSLCCSITLERVIHFLVFELVIRVGGGSGCTTFVFIG